MYDTWIGVVNGVMIDVMARVTLPSSIILRFYSVGLTAPLSELEQSKVERCPE